MNPTAVKLALIVDRLRTDRHGWRVDSLCWELEIAPRTYRKYRYLLQHHFPPFNGSRGHRLLEVEERDGRYLRLVTNPAELHLLQGEGPPRLAGEGASTPGGPGRVVWDGFQDVIRAEQAVRIRMADRWSDPLRPLALVIQGQGSVLLARGSGDPRLHILDADEVQAWEPAAARAAEAGGAGRRRGRRPR